MADDESAETPAIWPMPEFRFLVTCDAFEVAFQEVTGLDVEADPVEYRAGTSKRFSAVKMPGLRKVSNVTLKKGVFGRGNAFWDWFDRIRMNTVERKTITVSLLDQNGVPTMTWTLKNAFPTKVTGTDLKAEGDEVAVDAIEIAHEGVEI
jgi:phage tail-like protein